MTKTDHIPCEKIKGKFYCTAEDVTKLLKELRERQDVLHGVVSKLISRLEKLELESRYCGVHPINYSKGCTDWDSRSNRKFIEECLCGWEDVTDRILWTNDNIEFRPAKNLSTGMLFFHGYLDGSKLFEWRSDGLYFRADMSVTYRRFTAGGCSMYHLDRHYKLSSDGKRVFRRKT